MTSLKSVIKKFSNLHSIVLQRYVMYYSLSACSVILYKRVNEVQAGIQSNDCYYTIPPPDAGRILLEVLTV